jgi:hypothetical protein
MTEFFTLYTLPISFDASNRFRTGEMPLVVSDLVSFYNQFTAFATELKGLWSFSNVPGTVRDDGTVDRSNVLAVTSLIIMKDAATRGTDAASFKFIEWWTRDYIQSSYANELIATFENIGYHAFMVSAKTGFQCDELKEIMKDKVNLFSGHSGVGKSALINRLDENLNVDKSFNVGYAGLTISSLAADGKYIYVNYTKDAEPAIPVEVYTWEGQKVGSFSVGSFQLFPISGSRSYNVQAIYIHNGQLHAGVCGWGTDSKYYHDWIISMG